MPLLELSDVIHDLFRQFQLIRGLLDERAIQLLDIVTVKHSLHRTDRPQFGLQVGEEILAEHAGLGCRFKTVVFEDVPASEDQILHAGQRDKIVDPGDTRLGSLAEADRAVLSQGANGLTQPSLDRFDAGDKCCTDGSQPNQEHSQFSFRFFHFRDFLCHCTPIISG